MGSDRALATTRKLVWCRAARHRVERTVSAALSRQISIRFWISAALRCRVTMHYRQGPRDADI
jgi:hypothetical protein